MKTIFALVTALAVFGAVCASPAAEPVVTGIEPDWGLNTATTAVTLSGQNLGAVDTVALFGGGPRLVGSSGLLFAHDVQVAGGYAFVAGGFSDSGLVIFDISGPDPIIVGTWEFPAETDGVGSDVCVVNGHAYLAGGDAGLWIIDVSSPQNPVAAGSLSTGGVAGGVFTVENRLYLADGDAGLLILDISDPANPALLGSYDTGGSSYRVQVRNGLAYVADWDRLSIIDVSDPNAPSLVGENESVNARDVFLYGDYAYVAAGESDLQVIDVSAPESPEIVGECPLSGDAAGVHVAWPHAYVAAGGSLQVVNIRDPHTPVWVGSYGGFWSACGVWVVDGLAYVTDWWALAVIDISPPDNPVVPIGYGTDVQILGDYAYGLTDLDGLAVVDVSDPDAPAVIGVCPGASGTALAVSGEYAYIASSQGLMVVDISDPTGPQIAGEYNRLESRNDVFVHGGLAYLLGYPNIIEIIDISDPTRPTLSNTITDGETRGIHVVGGHAYVAGGAGGLHIYDLSDPINPVLRGTCDTPGTALKVFVVSARAYVADGSGGLQVVNVADPESPFIIGSCGTTGGAYDVHVAGRFAFVSARERGLEIIDVSETDATFEPKVVDGCRVYPFPNGVQAAGKHAYVAFGGGGIKIVRVLEPCEVLAVSDASVTAVVPAGLPEGTYNLHVADTAGAWGFLPTAFTVLPGQATCAQGQKADINGLLCYLSPSDVLTTLPPGTDAFTVQIVYRADVVPGSFRAALNRTDVSGLFNPVPGSTEAVTIAPLVPGRNTLELSMDGPPPVSGTATDRDRLWFYVE